jgi:hypothetical protein
MGPKGRLRSINCFIHPTPTRSLDTVARLDSGTAVKIAKDRLVELGRWHPVAADIAAILKYQDPSASLYYWQPDVSTPLKLAWVVDVRPNMIDWYRFFIDAGDGAILEFYNNT